jgi:hypothetical protein
MTRVDVYMNGKDRGHCRPRLGRTDRPDLCDAGYQPIVAYGRAEPYRYAVGGSHDCQGARSVRHWPPEYLRGHLAVLLPTCRFRSTSAAEEGERKENSAVQATAMKFGAGGGAVTPLGIAASGG